MEDHQNYESQEEPQFSEHNAPSVAAIAHPGGRIAWENYLRCLFLVCIIFLVGLMAWRPGALRLSILMSLTSPSPGGSLAWSPEPDPAAPLPEIKRVRPPAEWRLGPVDTSVSGIVRPRSKSTNSTGGALSASAWRRFSFNPWNWQNDVAEAKRRDRDLSALPAQKPETSFRVGNIIAWPDSLAASNGARGQNGSFELSSIPSLPALPGLQSAETGGFPAPLPALSLPPLASPGMASEGLGVPNLPPPLPARENRSANRQAGEAPAQPQALSALEPVASMAPPAAPAMRSPISNEAPQSLPLPGNASVTAKPEDIDWKNREITRTIPGAYLTIYPKLKFIGLCVPGQGYIRKYNQVGVPADTSNPKMNARDGRTPYGKYYIADRHRDEDGPRLFLSWPSPDDAKRIGLDTGRIAEVDTAWRRQELPPQDTVAGGGVGLSGLRNWVETTEGGFTLEEPQMEEIFTALPDKAPVFIQP